MSLRHANKNETYSTLGLSHQQTFDTDLGGKHTVTKSEEKAFSNWINKHLSGDKDCEALGLIPINPENDGELYERCKNGIILAKMINVAVPNTIDDRTLEKGESLKAIFKVCISSMNFLPNS